MTDTFHADEAGAPAIPSFVEDTSTENMPVTDAAPNPSHAEDEFLTEMVQKTLGDEAISKIDSRVASKEMTVATRIKLNRERRERGAKALHYVRRNVPSVMEKVAIKHIALLNPLYDMFDVVNSSLYALDREGPRILSVANANMVREALVAKVDEAKSILIKIKTSVEAQHVEAFAAAKAQKMEWVHPEIQNASEPFETQVRSPEALSLLKLIISLEKTFEQADDLHWNGLKSRREIEELTSQVGRALRSLGVPAGKALRSLYETRARQQRAQAQEEALAAQAIADETAGGQVAA